MNKGQRARKKTLRSKIVEHHLRYAYNGLTHKQEARTVYLFHNEHYLTRLLQTRGKYVSKGFLFVLADFILDRLITGNFVDMGITDLSASQKSTIEKIPTPQLKKDTISE